MITVAVDAMGGDHAPGEVLRAAAELSLTAPHLQVILVGDGDIITVELRKLRHDPERISVRHAAQRIEMHENPTEALAAKPDASILSAVKLVARGDAAALVSAGHTGAAVVACAQKWKRIPGVRRAALAAVYPTALRHGQKQDPFSLLLDVGATIDARAEDLVAFALMGSAYAARVSRNPRPRVALLSNGQEAGKGPSEVVRANEILKGHAGLDFIGNIEGVDIPRGTADVVVCSGFIGNVVLKMLEGVSETVLELAHYAYKQRLAWRVGMMMLSGGMQQLKDLTDWEQYGGAPVLGFDRLFIKAHGRSRARALANAVKVAAKASQGDWVGEIERGLRALKIAS
jgi:glycerol-3-phosphate acyltransferase PlsX